MVERKNPLKLKEALEEMGPLALDNYCQLDVI